MEKKLYQVVHHKTIVTVFEVEGASSEEEARKVVMTENHKIQPEIVEVSEVEEVYSVEEI